MLPHLPVQRRGHAQAEETLQQIVHLPGVLPVDNNRFRVMYRDPGRSLLALESEALTEITLLARPISVLGVFALCERTDVGSTQLNITWRPVVGWLPIMFAILCGKAMLLV